jgi:hypothetical protein
MSQMALATPPSFLEMRSAREREREVDYSFQASKKANYHEWKEKVLQSSQPKLANKYP